MRINEYLVADILTQVMYTFVAKVDGNWGAWTIHSCDSTCRGFKTRRCDDPPPVRGGKTCAGADREQYGDCTGHHCVQNGKYKPGSISRLYFL